MLIEYFHYSPQWFQFNTKQLNTKEKNNKKAEERNIRKLTKVGKKTIAVTIPIEIVRSLGWREKQRVKIKRVRGGFEVRDFRSK